MHEQLKQKIEAAWDRRETLDRKAITEAFGEEAIAPYVKATSFKTVKLVEN